MVALTALAGCNKTEQITRYTVKKPVPMKAVGGGDPHAGLDLNHAPTGEPKDRTLGAIVPFGAQGWFFKLTGPKDLVAAQTETFNTLVKSVHFSADGKPQWTLPDGWQARPGNDIRYATLVIPGESSSDKPLEVSVTALPRSGDDDLYVLVNINRWRGQLKLPDITAAQMAEQSTQIPLTGATATVVDLLGTAAPGGMGGAPFMSGARNGN